jgi:hypothetical protein
MHRDNFTFTFTLGQVSLSLCIAVYILFCAYLAKYSSERKLPRTEVVELYVQNTLPESLVVFEITKQNWYYEHIPNLHILQSTTPPTHSQLTKKIFV